MTANRTAILAIRTLAVAGALLAINWLVIRPFRCAQVVHAIELQLMVGLPQLPADRVAAVARENLRNLQTVAPGCEADVDLHIALAANASLLGRHEEALGYLRRALRADDRPEIHFNIGLTLLDMGRVDEAAGELAIACEFNEFLLGRIQGELQQRVMKEVAQLKAIHAREVRR